MRRVVLHITTQRPPFPTEGLSRGNAIVCVGPPLSASGRNMGSATGIVGPQVVPGNCRLWPRSKVVPQQFGSRPPLAIIVVLTERLLLKRLAMAPPPSGPRLPENVLLMTDNVPPLAIAPPTCPAGAAFALNVL